MMMLKVCIESPFAGRTAAQRSENLQYARACMADSLGRGEAPIASHLLYTQEGILDDTVKEERNKGIEAGFAWNEYAEYTLVYADLGISSGMWRGIKDALDNGRKVFLRSIFYELETPLQVISG